MNIKDIANELGVSISTVSLVLNNKPGVRKETRERVAQLLTENNYTIRALQPEAAEPFSRGELIFICFQAKENLPERNNEFFVGVLDGAQRCARQAGYTLGVVNADYEELQRLLPTLNQQKNVLGIALLGSEYDIGKYVILDQITCPLVAIDVRFPYSLLNTVNTDNLAGTFNALSYLHQLGHEQIGLLASALPMGGLPERETAYFKAMKKLGLPINQEHILRIDHVYAHAIAQMDEHLQKNPSLPTAFFAANDVIAAGAMRALKQQGIRVPEDISIIGFDDATICEIIRPLLTTMRIDCPRLGEMAIERLMQLLNGQTDVIKMDLGTQLVVRDSTAPRK